MSNASYNSAAKTWWQQNSDRLGGELDWDTFCEIWMAAQNTCCPCCDPSTVDIQKLIDVGCNHCSACGQMLKTSIALKSIKAGETRILRFTIDQIFEEVARRWMARMAQVDEAAKLDPVAIQSPEGKTRLSMALQKYVNKFVGREFSTAMASAIVAEAQRLVTPT